MNQSVLLINLVVFYGFSTNNKLIDITVRSHKGFSVLIDTDSMKIIINQNIVDKRLPDLVDVYDSLKNDYLSGTGTLEHDLRYFEKITTVSSSIPPEDPQLFQTL